MCDFRKRAAVSPHGGDKNDEILDRPGQDRPDHNPKKSRKEPELCRQYRTEERTRSGNGRKMMTKEDIFICGVKIRAVFQAMRRGAATVVEIHDTARKEPAIKAVGQRLKT